MAYMQGLMTTGFPVAFRILPYLTRRSLLDLQKGGARVAN